MTSESNRTREITSATTDAGGVSTDTRTTSVHASTQRVEIRREPQLALCIYTPGPIGGLGGIGGAYAALTPDQARHLAALLTAAADGVPAEVDVA